MTDAGGLRAIAFGTADGGLWGAAFDHGAGAIVAGAGETSVGLAGAIHFADLAGGGWRVEGDGVRVDVTPVTPPTAPAEAPPAPGTPWAPGGDPELCTVTGTLGALGEIDGVGVRVTVEAPTSAKAAPSSARLVGAWLADGAAVSALAVRPGRESHQDADRTTATVFDSERWTTVDEPRLSTSYAGSGSPTRCYLELWIGSGDDELVRRAAGEAVGAGASVSGDGEPRLALEVVPLRTHSRGEDGGGVYAIATFS